MSTPVLVPDIEHTIGDWTSDDPYVHWQECECGFRANIADHQYEYVVDKEPTETTPGYKHHECSICGYKKAQIEIPALGGGTDGGEPPVDTNPTDTTPNQGGFLGFIQMVWNVIIDFFRRIFGLA